MVKRTTELVFLFIKAAVFTFAESLIALMAISGCQPNALENRPAQATRNPNFIYEPFFIGIGRIKFTEIRFCPFCHFSIPYREV